MRNHTNTHCDPRRYQWYYKAMLMHEETLPIQSLMNSFSLNDEERYVLADLGYRARSFAPSLGKTLTVRIQQFAIANTGCLSSSEDIQMYLQDWFLQLFQCREEKYIEFQEYFSPVPVNLIVIGIDIILAYGHKITQFSINPEIAVGAFYKMLVLKIANDQLQIQIEESQHFCDLILLD